MAEVHEPVRRIGPHLRGIHSSTLGHGLQRPLHALALPREPAFSVPAKAGKNMRVAGAQGGRRDALSSLRVTLMVH